MSRQIDPASFGFLVTDIARMLRAEMDQRISASGLDLTPGEMRLLAQAARAGQARQSVLAERIGVEAMTVSTYLDRLEGRGLVRRVPDPSDRRAKLVELTDQADAVLDRMRAFGDATRAHASAGIEPADWKTAIDVLKAVRCNLSDARLEQRNAQA